ncbi:hypothetical protein C8Q70DRAFT_390225 [Cubamyces menziesii]|nr:hypothetical protein C8Q70DRAFT_390225 [Cubamyces menziesii]
MSQGIGVDELAVRHQELTKQRAALDRELLSVSHALNAMQPANKLPVELLIKIFSMIQVDNGEYTERWYSVAGVCKYWYEVANNCISLWRRVKLGSSIHLVDVSLARPDVTVEGVRGRLPDFVNNSPALERIRGHIMDVSQHRTHGRRSRGCYLQNALRRIGKMAMLVEVLVVHDKRPRLSISEDHSEEYGYSNGPEEDGEDSDERGQYMDITTFEGRFTATLEIPVDSEMFPRLQSLTLITAVPSRFVPPPTLRTLHLYDCVRMSLTMGTFLTLISQCQALEELTLRRFRPMDDHLPASIERDAPKNITPIRPVALPKSLRKVSMQDIAPWTARLLEGMALSGRIYLRVAMTGGSDCLPLDQFWNTALYHAFPYSKAHLRPLRRADTVRIELDTAAIRYRITAHSSIKQRENGAFVAISNNEFVHRTNCIPSLLRDVCKLFHKAPVADLTIAVLGTLGLKKAGEDHWAAALKSLPRLRCLAVSLRVKTKPGCSDPLMDMLKVLGRPCSDGTEICPKLEALTLHFVDTNHETAMLPSVEDCLKCRAARDYRVYRLIITLNRLSWKSADEWAAIEESALERYKSLFQPYVETVCCGDASYFSQAGVKQQ